MWRSSGDCDFRFQVCTGIPASTSLLSFKLIPGALDRSTSAAAGSNLARARNLDDFRKGLEYFDFGSENFAYADMKGNIAYFTSAEIPGEIIASPWLRPA